MSLKHNSLRRSNVSPGNDRKKLKTVNGDYLCEILQESGLILKRPPEKCVMSQETIHTIRNIKKNIQKHFEYPRNISEIYSSFVKQCENMDVLKHFLYPNIVRVVESSPDEHHINDSVVKILLNVPILQNKLIDYIFEKAIDLAAESQCGPWIQIILKCLSSLDCVGDGEKVATHLINLLDVATETNVKLEIITYIPEIIGDQQHPNIANELSRTLSEDHNLIPVILDCLSYLNLSDEEYLHLQNKCLSILISLPKCSYFPNFIKFLLLPRRVNDTGYLEIIQGLRNTLSWPSSIASPDEIASSQVLTASALRNSIVSSKVIANSWVKVISLCKSVSEHKPIDLIILLILYTTSEEKQKQVENLIRKHVKLNVVTEELLDEALELFKPIFTYHVKHLINLTNSLLKTKTEPLVESFASHIYTLMLSKFEDSCQTIIAELLQLGLDRRQCTMNMLNILNKVATEDLSLLKSHSIQMLTLLDRLEDMSLMEVRSVMNLLCGLAYSCENSVIRDDIHMIIRKELSSSNPIIKIQGILAGVHAVKYLMKTNADEDNTIEMPDDISYSSITHLSDGDLRQAAQIVELISRSTRQFPDMIAFFYDEMSKVIGTAPHINKHFLSWLTDAVTNDLQQNFIVDAIATENVGDLKLIMQYCINTDSEMDDVIAINIAGLALQNNNEINVAILSSLFQLVQTLHSKQHDGNLTSIDALLGCPVVMPKFDIDFVEDMEYNAICNILNCLIHCVNWFRESINAFATQNDAGLKSKMYTRIQQVDELETIIFKIITKTKIAYKPDVYFFDINKYIGQKSDSIKIRAQKKTTNADTSAAPDTTRTQTTQNNSNAKLSVDSGLKLPLRELKFDIVHLLDNQLSNEDSDSNMNIKTFKFLTKCVNNIYENFFIPRQKRKTFLTKNEDTSSYDAKSMDKYAEIFCNLIPKVTGHLKNVTLYIESHESDENEHGFLFTPEVIDYLTCLENLYKMFNIFFNWIGFKTHNKSLLKKCLKAFSLESEETIRSTATPLKEIVITTLKELQKHEKYCLQLSTAVSLVDLIETIKQYAENTIVTKVLKDVAFDFLSKQWKSIDGALEKGLSFNQSIDKLTKIYFINNEVLQLKKISLELIEEIKLLQNKSSTLNKFKCINKSNFTILYRHMGTALLEATKTHLNKVLTNTEHLVLWKDVTLIMKQMADIAKTLETRNNLSAFFKKSMPVLKLFLSQGIPMLELEFKNETQEVLEILKILQQSTRFVQSLCCHSRLKKDTVLMSKVPYMRQLLETLIYKVKAMLTANNCSEAFWMGNLKNKNIHGEVIATQQSQQSEESNEDCDDQLPEDESDDSEEEMNPDSKSISDIV